MPDTTILPNPPSPLEPFARADTLDEKAKRFEAASQEKGFWENLSDFSLDDLRDVYQKGSLGAIPHYFKQLGTVPDDNFVFDDEAFKRYSRGIEPRYWHYFEDVIDRESAENARWRAGSVQSSDQTISAHGGVGQAANVMASILSPENVVATVATMGIGTGVGVAKGVGSGVTTFRAANLSRAAGMGFINAAATLPIDILVADDLSDYNGWDVAANFGAGFAGGFASDALVAQRIAGGAQLQNRLTRFGAVGAAQGVGGAVPDFFNDERSSADMATAFAVNFAFGGGLNAIPSSRKPTPLSQSLNDNWRDMADRSTLSSVKNNGAPVTPKGEARATELDLKIKRRAADEFSLAVGEDVVAGTPNPKIREAVTTEWKAASDQVSAVRSAATEVVDQGSDPESMADLFASQARKEMESLPQFYDYEHGGFSGDVGDMSHPHVRALRDARNLHVAQSLEKQAKSWPELRDTSAYKSAAVSLENAWEEGRKRSPEEVRKLVGAPAATGGAAGTSSGPEFAVGAASQKELSAVDPDTSIDPVEGWKSGYFYVGGVKPGPHDWGMLDFLPDAAKRWASWSSQGGGVAMSPDKLTSFFGKALGSFGLSGQSSLHFQRKQFIEAERGRRFIAADGVYKKYVQAEKDAGRKPLKRDAFNRSMFAYMSQKETGTDIPNPILDEYAKVIDDSNRRVREMVGTYDKRNTQEHVPYKLPHYWNGEAIERLTRNQNAGYERTVEGIASAVYERIRPNVAKVIKQAQSLFPEELVQTAFDRARSIARAEAERIVANAGRRHEAFVASDARALSTDARAVVSQWIDDTLGNKITAQEKSDLLFRLGPEGVKDGPTFMRSRIEIDPLAAIEFKRVYGDKLGAYGDGGKESVLIADLMEQNVEVLHDRFLHQGSSYGALKELLRVAKAKFPTEEIPDVTDFNELTAWIKKRAEDLRQKTPLEYADTSGKIHKVNPERFAQDAITIDVLMRQLHDRSGFDIADPNLQSLLVGINNLSRMASSSAIGNLGMPIQNAAVATDLVADSGLKAFKKIIPRAWDYVRNVRDGKATPSRFDIMWANDMGWGLGPTNGRPMDVMFDDDTAFQKGWASRASMNYQHTIGKLSGDAYTNAGFGIAARVMAKEYFHEALMGENMLDSRFLRDTGLSMEDAREIRRQYAKHHRTREDFGGAFDPRVDQWDNKKAAALYTSAVEQHAARSFNLIDKSKRPRFLSNPLMAPLGSLRSWAIGAWDNYLLRRTTGLVDDDGLNTRHAIAFVTGSAAAVTLYTIRAYVMSIGRPDQKEYLERMLSDKSIAMAALGKPSWASIMPAVADTAFSLARQEPPFAKGRVSGLGDRPDPFASLTGIPLGSWAKDATQTLGVPFGYLLGDHYEMNQADARAALNSAFVPNLFNLKNFLQRTYDDLPRSAPREAVDNSPGGSFILEQLN